MKQLQGCFWQWLMLKAKVLKLEASFHKSCKLSCRVCYQRHWAPCLVRLLRFQTRASVWYWKIEVSQLPDICEIPKSEQCLCPRSPAYVSPADRCGGCFWSPGIFLVGSPTPWLGVGLKNTSLCVWYLSLVCFLWDLSVFSLEEMENSHPVSSSPWCSWLWDSLLSCLFYRVAFLNHFSCSSCSVALTIVISGLTHILRTGDQPNSLDSKCGVLMDLYVTAHSVLLSPFLRVHSICLDFCFVHPSSFHLYLLISAIFISIFDDFQPNEAGPVPISITW